MIGAPHCVWMRKVVWKLVRSYQLPPDGCPSRIYVLDMSFWFVCVYFFSRTFSLAFALHAVFLRCPNLCPSTVQKFATRSHSGSFATGILCPDCQEDGLCWSLWQWQWSMGPEKRLRKWWWWWWWWGGGGGRGRRRQRWFTYFDGNVFF